MMKIHGESLKPFLNETYIYDAINLFHHLAGLTPRMEHNAFNLWFILKYPNLLEEGQHKDKIQSLIETGHSHNYYDYFLATATGN